MAIFSSPSSLQPPTISNNLPRQVHFVVPNLTATGVVLHLEKVFFFAISSEQCSNMKNHTHDTAGSATGLARVTISEPCPQDFVIRDSMAVQISRTSQRSSIRPFFGEIIRTSTLTKALPLSVPPQKTKPSLPLLSPSKTPPTHLHTHNNQTQHLSLTPPVPFLFFLKQEPLPHSLTHSLTHKPSIPTSTFYPTNLNIHTHTNPTNPKSNIHLFLKELEL